MPATKKKNLTVNQKRVLLAKDILKQLKSRRYFAEYMATLGVEVRKEINAACHLDPSTSAQEIVKQQEKCGVCAAGACLLAYVERFNNVTVGQIYHDGFTKTLGNIPGFNEVFSPALLAEIETIYERKVYDWNERKLGAGLANEVRSHSFSFPTNSDERLTKIMRLLVKHKGSYVAFREVAGIKVTKPVALAA